MKKYIPECIQSIEKQTYDINKIQIVLINDGSKDNSLKVCKELEKRKQQYYCHFSRKFWCISSKK